MTQCSYKIGGLFAMFKMRSMHYRGFVIEPVMSMYNDKKGFAVLFVIFKDNVRVNEETYLTKLLAKVAIDVLLKSLLPVPLEHSYRGVTYLESFVVDNYGMSRSSFLYKEKKFKTVLAVQQAIDSQLDIPYKGKVILRIYDGNSNKFTIKDTDVSFYTLEEAKEFIASGSSETCSDAYSAFVRILLAFIGLFFIIACMCLSLSVVRFVGDSGLNARDTKLALLNDTPFSSYDSTVVMGDTLLSLIKSYEGMPFAFVVTDRESEHTGGASLSGKVDMTTSGSYSADIAFPLTYTDFPDGVVSFTSKYISVLIKDSTGIIVGVYFEEINIGIDD